MTQILDRQVFQEVLEQAGLDDSTLRDDFRGRGMLTESCFGIIVGQAEREGFALFATMAESDTFRDMLMGARDLDLTVADFANKARVENMGKSLIIYFPGYELTP